MKPFPLRYLESGERPSDAPPPYDLFFFDCDSTLADIEGIDDLARKLPPPECRAVEALTDEAMGGGRTLEEVYGLRLERIHPNRADVDGLGARYVAALLPNAKQLVAALAWLGKEVHVISGGLLPAVREVAEVLGLSADRVHAVDLEFDDSGTYRDFERSSPLCREGGKPEVVAAVAAKATEPPRIVLVGDGTTDIETAPLLARFVAFGGVKRRDVVFERARVSATSPDLAALLPLLCSAEELEALAKTSDFGALVAPFLI